MLGAPLAHMPQITRAAPVRPPPPPPAARAPDPLYVFLKPEIDQGLVTVLGNHAMPIVRIRNTGMFASGSATVATGLLPPAGAHRRGAEGREGRRDGRRLYRQPADPHRAVPVQLPAIHGPRRGGACASSCGALGDPGRVAAQGHADADPMASNATPEGREENRRIEVVLRRQG